MTTRDKARWTFKAMMQARVELDRNPTLRLCLLVTRLASSLRTLMDSHQETYPDQYHKQARLALQQAQDIAEHLITDAVLEDRKSR